jgi:excisionase family DNA binding protein
VVKGDGMDKICIVKLRKKMTDPAMLRHECGQGNQPGEGQGVSGPPVPAHEDPGLCEARDRKGNTEKDNGSPDRTVSLMLTPEQMRVLQSNPSLLSFLNGAAARGSSTPLQVDETIVFKFAFEPPPPVRLLKMGEVIELLRISKGYLRKIVRQGELKSYKIGRLRRIMFDDILSYLEDSQEVAGAGQRVSQKISQGRVV